MKRFLFLALALFTIHCSLFTLDVSAQSRTNRLTRPCPGSTTPATVSIAVGGNIAITPCASGTVTINGTRIPQGVKVYRALLTQDATDAPVVTVLENSLGGTVVWTRASAGFYKGTLAGAFPLSKTQTFISQYSPSTAGDFSLFEFWGNDDAGDVRVTTRDVDLTANTATLTDGMLARASVKILVYP